MSPGTGHGRKRSPLHEHRAWLLALNQAEPDLTLIEVRDRLASERGVVTAEASVWRFFAREGIRFKKTLLPSEQDRRDVARRRASWKRYQGRIAADRLVPSTGSGQASSTRPGPGMS